MIQDIKERWREEYLLSLREASRDNYQRKWEDVVKIDDIVLIASATKTRPFWQLARIKETLKCKDEKIRTVRIIRPYRTKGVNSLSIFIQWN